MASLFRKSPIILSGLFIFITYTRVASFSTSTMKAGFLGYVFSLGLGAAVFVSAYWTKAGNRSSTVRDQVRLFWVSWLALSFFMFADGFFNLIDVLLSVGVQNGVWVIIAAWIYGLFPTIAAATLGVLQGIIDRLPVAPSKYDVGKLLRKLLYQKFTLYLPLEEESKPVSKAKNLALPEKIHQIKLEHPEFTNVAIAKQLGISKAYVGQVLNKSVDGVHSATEVVT